VRASEPARPQDEPPPVVAPLASSALSSPATRPAAPAVSAPAAPKPAPLSRLIDAVVMAAGIAAVGLAVAVFAPLAFDLHPVAMADKTMEPAVREGALVIAEKVLVADLKVGDVVVYAPAQERGKVLTRRVATVDQGSGGPAGVKITTKADQLPNPDPYTIDGTQSVGRVVYSVPVAGRILSASGRREGFLVLGGVIVLQMLLRAAQRARREGAAA